MGVVRPALDDEQGLRRQCARVCRLMYERGHVVGTDGNASVRLGRRRLLVTPTGAHKGLLEPADLVRTDLSGRPVPGERGRPSGEIALHVRVYDERPDVAAIVHAHPAAAVACSLAGVDLGQPVVPESVLALGGVPTVPYATPTTDDLARAAAPYLREGHGLLLARHGTLTTGPDLTTAFCRLETLEHTARIVCLARLLGPVQPLAPDEVERLQGLAGSGGERPADLEAIVARATAAVLERLGRAS